jgi:hypothetical protein
MINYPGAEFGPIFNLINDNLANVRARKPTPPRLGVGFSKGCLFKQLKIKAKEK